MVITIDSEIIQFIVKIFAIATCSLGIVYLFGKMVYILRTDLSKNVFAIISCLTFSWFLVLVENKTLWITYAELNFIDWLDYIMQAGLYFLSSIVVYILFGWRLFWRVDKFLDKKVGNDNDYNK